MSIPQTPDYFLVQNIFQLDTGLPADVAVNTFIFRNTNLAGGAQPTSAEQRAANAVRDFYVGSAPALPNAATSAANIMSRMAASVTGWTQKVYDLGRPPGGRVPFVVDRAADMVPRGSGAPLPPEVSIVASLQTPIIGRRGKGRIYLGPWTSALLAPGTGGSPVEVNIRNRIAAQAARLALGNDADMEWAVFSPTRQAMARVIGGHVDDSWDIQRRRGFASTMRTKWGNTTPTTAP